MKKITVCVASLIATLSLASQAFSQSLITNPSFEGAYNPAPGGNYTGSIANGWTINVGFPSGSKATFSRDSGTFHSGLCSQKITLTTAGSNGVIQFFQNLNLVGGHSYTMSAWVKADRAANINLVGQDNSNYTPYLGGFNLPVSTTWQQVTISGTCTASGGSVSTLFYIGQTTPCTIWVDDVTVYDVTPGVNLVQNPGFSGTYNPVNYPTITGNIANGWMDNSSWSTASIQYSSATGRNGGLCQQINYTSGGSSNGPVQFVSVLPRLSYGRLYNTSVWLKASQPTNVAFLIREIGGNYAAKISDWSVPLTTTWTQYNLAGQVDNLNDGNNGSYFFMIYLSTPGVTVWVDDASLTDVTPPLPASPISKQFFGMHFSDNQGSPALPWPSNYVGLYRLWDGSTDWAALQPTTANAGSNTNNWNQSAVGIYDKCVNDAVAKSADLIMTLGMTPPWATTYSGPNYYGPSTPGVPSNIQYWKDYVTGLATRYKGKVHYWEIWNEPFDPRFFAGTPTDLVNLYQAAYSILKSIDPTNQIIGPAVPSSYMQSFITAGGNSYCDIYNDHSYLNSWPGSNPQTPEDVLTDLGGIRQTLTINNINKPIWITEQGWYVFDGSGYTYNNLSTAFMARTYLMDWAYGLEGRVGWYRWDYSSVNNQIIQLTAPTNNNTLTATGSAQAILQNWLGVGSGGGTGGVVMTGLTRNASDIWCVTITRPYTNPTYVGYIVWSPSTTGSSMSFPSNNFTLPTRMSTLEGGLITNSGGYSAAVNIGSEPVLWENKAP